MTWVCLFAGGHSGTMSEKTLCKCFSKARSFSKDKAIETEKTGEAWVQVPPSGEEESDYGDRKWQMETWLRVLSSWVKLKLQNGQFKFISKKNTLSWVMQTSVCKLPDDQKRQSYSKHSEDLLQNTSDSDGDRNDTRGHWGPLPRCVCHSELKCVVVNIHAHQIQKLNPEKPHRASPSRTYTNRMLKLPLYT